MMDSRYKRLAKNTLLVFAGSLGARLISLFMMPLYTRWLSVEDYGLTDLLTIYVSFLLSIVSCCMQEAFFVFPKGANLDFQKKYFSSGLLFNIGTGTTTAIVFIIISIFGNIYDIHNSFIDNIWFIYVMLITNIAQQLFQQFTRSTDHMIVYSLTGLIYTLCVAIFAFVLIPQTGVVGYIWSIIISNIIASLFSFWGAKSYKYFCIHCFDRKMLDEMLKYAVPLIPNGIMWWLVSSLNRPLMEHYLGLHDIGIYAVANRFPGIMSMVFMVFATSWQISVLEEFKEKGYSQFYNRILRLVFALLVVCQIIITFSSHMLINIFADEEFNEAWKYVSLLTIGTFWSSLSGFVGTTFSATRETKYLLYSSVWGAATAITFNYLLIPIWGLWGACISITLSFSIMTLSRIIYAWKNVRVTSIGYYLIMFSLMYIMIVLNISTKISFSIVVAILSIVLLFIHEKQLIKTMLTTIKYKIIK